MKLTNCLKIFFAVVFIVGVLTPAYAGQKRLGVSPAIPVQKKNDGINQEKPKIEKVQKIPFKFKTDLKVFDPVYGWVTAIGDLAQSGPVLFQWAFTGTGSLSGEYQVSNTAGFGNVLQDGTLPGNNQQFHIDFKNILPSPTYPLTYYVRVTPLTESELYMPSNTVMVSILEPPSYNPFD